MSRPNSLPFLSPAQLAVLMFLLDSCDRAKRFRHPTADFAVTYRELRDLNATDIDLRTLVCARLIRHGLEQSQRRSRCKRRFIWTNSLRFEDDSSFVITAAGVAVARTTCPTASADAIPAPRSNGAVRPLPHWDGEIGELRYRGRLVKRFRQSAASQRSVLAGFEAVGWRRRIPNPLPDKPHVPAQERLHDAIGNLNQDHRCRGLRFRGDGTGQGVIWEDETQKDA